MVLGVDESFSTINLIIQTTMAFLPSIVLGPNTFNGINKPGQYVLTTSSPGLPQTISIIPNSTPSKTYFSFDRKWMTAGPVINGQPSAPYVSSIKIVVTSTDPAFSPTICSAVIAEQAAFLTAGNVTRICRNEN